MIGTGVTMAWAPGVSLRICAYGRQLHWDPSHGQDQGAIRGDCVPVNGMVAMMVQESAFGMVCAPPPPIPPRFTPPAALHPDPPRLRLVCWHCCRRRESVMVQVGRGALHDLAGALHDLPVRCNVN